MNSAFAFLGFGDNEPVDPKTLKTDEARMKWLKENNPKLFMDMSKVGTFPADKKRVWKAYLEETLKPYDPEDEERAKQERIQELKDAHKKKEDAEEAKLKEGYKMINGELISKADQERIQKNKAKKIEEMERVVRFYKEMNIPVPKSDKEIKIKDE
jgi:hypothetical protein